MNGQVSHTDSSNAITSRSSEWGKLVLFAVTTRFLLLFLAYIYFAASSNQNANFLEFKPVYCKQVITSFRYADVVWYMDIAENGYLKRSFTPDEKVNWAFYPFWPLLLRANNVLIGEMLISGMLLSTFFFVLAILVLYELVALDYDRQIARLAAVLVIIFPSSYFCLRPGPESLFLLLVFSSIYSARRKRWGLAGLLGGLATLTRLQGFVLVLPLLFIYCRQYEASRTHRYGVISLALIPSAQLGFMFFLYRLTGNPFANLLMQRAWDNDLSVPFTGMVRYVLQPHLISYYGWDMAIVTFMYIVFCLVLFALMIRTYPLPGEYMIYTGLSLLLIVSRANMNASLRYMIPIFPLFLVLALLIYKRKWLYDGVIFGFGSLQIFYFLAFIQHYNWAAT